MHFLHLITELSVALEQITFVSPLHTGHFIFCVLLLVNTVLCFFIPTVGLRATEMVSSVTLCTGQFIPIDCYFFNRAVFFNFLDFANIHWISSIPSKTLTILILPCAINSSPYHQLAKNACFAFSFVV